MGSTLVWPFYMIVFYFNIFYRQDNSCMEDSFRWCCILFLSASARFAADAMKDSSVLRVGFVMYFCLNNTFPRTLVASVSFTHSFQQR